MKNLFIAFFILGLFSCSQQQDSNQENLAKNIIGGRKLNSSLQKQLGIVGLVINSPDGQDICAGTLIARRVVLTAAHCVAFANTNPGSIKVIFSNNIDKAQFADVRKSKSFVFHEKYLSLSMGIDPNPNNVWNDIALVFLSEEAPKDFFVAQLASENLLTPLTQILESGFGKNSLAENQVSQNFLKVVSRINFLKMSADQSEINLEETTKGSCDGDSGGPAFIRNSKRKLVQVGVNSRSQSNDSCLGTGVFTNVSHFHDWIQTKIKENLDK